MKIAILGTRGIPNNYGGFEQFAEYLALGFNGHLKKPIERTEFIDIIAKYYAPVSEN